LAALAVIRNYFGGALFRSDIFAPDKSIKGRNYNELSIDLDEIGLEFLQKHLGALGVAETASFLT
jgi:hypothetical protein